MGEAGHGASPHRQVHSMHIHSMHIPSLPGLPVHPAEVLGVTFNTEARSPLATETTE